MLSGSCTSGSSRARSPSPTAHNGLLRIIAKVHRITVQVDVGHRWRGSEVVGHDSDSNNRSTKNRLSGTMPCRLIPLGRCTDKPLLGDGA
jgi:hypothetical protein